jgi:hypothetical protein
MFFVGTALLSGLAAIGWLTASLISSNAQLTELFLIMAIASAALGFAFAIGALGSTWERASIVVRLGKLGLYLAVFLALFPFVVLAGVLIFVFTLPPAILLLPMVAWDAAEGDKEHVERRRVIPRAA